MISRMDGKNIYSVGAAILLVMMLASCGISLIPTKDVWFTQHYIIMQDFERNAYRTLSDAGRLGFQELFWKYRTAQAKEMYQGRLEYVKKNFWKENSSQPWNTDRSRVFLLNGSPVAIDYDQNVSWGSVNLPGQAGAAGTDRSNEDVQANRAEIWTYQFRQSFVKYAFVFVTPNSWKTTAMPASGNQYRGELEDSSRNVDFGISDLTAYQQELAVLEKKK
jgi:GWxTD domain-containing protein